jgi:hypothetical protein
MLTLYQVACIARLFSAKNKIGGAAWVERKQNPVRSALMLDAQFLHICMTGIANCIDMRTT